MDGKKLFLPTTAKESPDEMAYCIQRKELNKLLLNIAENNNISVYFGYAFKNADLNDNKFIF